NCRASLHVEKRDERRFESRMQEGIAEPIQGIRNGSLAAEEQRVGHFAQHDAQNEWWYREDRRTVHDSCERLRKFGVLRRLRRDSVDWASHVFIVQSKSKNRDGLSEGQPRHPLLPGANLPA